MKRRSDLAQCRYFLAARSEDDGLGHEELRFSVEGLCHGGNESGGVIQLSGLNFVHSKCFPPAFSTY